MLKKHTIDAVLGLQKVVDQISQIKTLATERGVREDHPDIIRYLKGLEELKAKHMADIQDFVECLSPFFEREKIYRAIYRVFCFSHRRKRIPELRHLQVEHLMTRILREGQGNTEIREGEDEIELMEEVAMKRLR